MTKSRRIKKRYRLKKKFSPLSILKNKYFWLSFFLILTVAAGVFHLIFGDFFQVSKIYLKGTREVSSKKIKELVSSKIQKNILPFYPKKARSIFLVREEKISNLVLNKFPSIKEIEIEKDYPDKLIINIRERSPVAVFCSSTVVKSTLDKSSEHIITEAHDDNVTSAQSSKNLSRSNGCFLIGEEGIAFRALSAASSDDIIISFSNNSRSTSLGEKIIDKNILNSILKIKRNLQDKIKINQAIVSEDEDKLTIKTSENWESYFSLSGDISLQITKLTLLLKKEITKEERKTLQYIDLRFSKAYYK